MNDFGSWLDAYINSQDPPIGRPELARRTDIDVTTIGRWIRGAIRPKPENLRALAPVLGVSYGELLTIAGYGAPTAPTEAAAIPKARPLDPLAVELGRMLDPDSPLTDEDRELLRLVVNQVMEPKRKGMRRRRSA